MHSNSSKNRYTNIFVHIISYHIYIYCMLMYLCIYVYIYILYVDVSMYMAMSIYIISLQVFSKVADRYRQVQTTALWDAACHWEHSSSLTRAAFEPASIANQPLSARQPWHGELAAAVPVRDMRTGMMPVLGLDYSLACCLIKAVALFSSSFSTFRSSFKACTASVLPSARAATPAGGCTSSSSPTSAIVSHALLHTHRSGSECQTEVPSKAAGVTVRR